MLHFLKFGGAFAPGAPSLLFPGLCNMVMNLTYFAVIDIVNYCRVSPCERCEQLEAEVTRLKMELKALQEAVPAAAKTGLFTTQQVGFAAGLQSLSHQESLLVCFVS